ncbi:FadR/GntR family transcriptional regulator [Frankia sp. Cas3]|uniref:FadR/GntR family transcriptional regulator n=1 Tax=Frankia sp. Cas3 TaxID=3073926 RepID=UPI002AD30D3F|nr:FCD domain-containing protein [Frankia sp. Cas3]
MSDRPVSLAKGRVRVNRVADIVADRIRELIVTGDLADGDRLPRLDVLLKDFGVSGPSMREALRVLESEGLITVQRGSIGGAVVHRPDAKTAAYIVALVLRSRGTQLRDVFEGMSLLEPVCAMLCARRPDRKTTVVSELRKVNGASRRLIDGDELAFNETMAAFHETLVQRCGNETLTLVAGILESIWLVHERSWAEAKTARGALLSRPEKLKRLESHEKICDLIEAGEERRVAEAMTEHIEVQFIYSEWLDPTERVDARAIRHDT